MTRTDPYENKYGNPDWCHKAQPDGRKAITSLLEEFREHPDRYLPLAGFQDKETGEACHIDDALDHGFPFAATLHDHVDHTNLHARWWVGGKEYLCKYKVTTGFMTVGEETPAPELAFTLLESGVYDREGSAEHSAGEYLQLRIAPCPCANERVDMWWSLTGRFDETLFHLALMPESNYWMQLP